MGMTSPLSDMVGGGSKDEQCLHGRGEQEVKKEGESAQMRGGVAVAGGRGLWEPLYSGSGMAPRFGGPDSVQCPALPIEARSLTHAHAESPEHQIIPHLLGPQFPHLEEEGAVPQHR